MSTTRQGEASLAQSAGICFSNHEAQTQDLVIDKANTLLALAQHQPLVMEASQDMKPLLQGKHASKELTSNNDGKRMSKASLDKDQLLVAPSKGFPKESGSSQGHGRTLPPAAAMLRDFKEQLSTGLERLPSSSSTSVHASQFHNSAQGPDFDTRASSASLPLEGPPSILDVDRLGQHPR